MLLKYLITKIIFVSFLKSESSYLSKRESIKVPVDVVEGTVLYQLLVIFLPLTEQETYGQGGPGRNYKTNIRIKMSTIR